MSSFTETLARECAAIRPLSEKAAARAQKHLDSLTKPVGSLGRLEEAALQLYAVQENMRLRARPARIYTIAADHGVTAEGVASSPQAVTRLMAENFLRGGAGINCLSQAAGAELRVVDAGIAGPDLPDHPLLIRARIARGTANMAEGPAMRQEECDKALELGISLAEQARQDGMRVVGTGEMGIGNTTASSALFCALLGFHPEAITGMGAGIPPGGLAHKASVITRALEANAGAMADGDARRILAAVGGLEIAALTGLILGAAARRMLVLIDGFISTAAYVVAERMAPRVRQRCLFCHGSAEAGHTKVLEALGIRPLLDLGLRLGEGTGVALGLMILEGAAAVFNGMATFEEAGIQLPGKAT